MHPSAKQPTSPLRARNPTRACPQPPPPPPRTADASYAGGVTWAGTGIQFSSSADVVRGAIALLRQRSPRTKVLVAVGGATYTNWAGLNPAAIRRFVDEFGLDGVDIDYGAPLAPRADFGVLVF